MMALASKTKVEETSSIKSTKTRKLREPQPEPVNQSSPIYGFPIQRKADCACGGGCLQCKQDKNNLRISQPNDAAEIEADRTAEKIMRMSDSEDVEDSEDSTDEQSEISETDDDEEEVISRKENPSAGKTQNHSRQQPFSNSTGKSLDSETQSFFESRFHTDLSEVKIHSGEEAANFADKISARAYTVGNNIGFAKDEYQPNSDKGRLLLAHELTHVIQQNFGGKSELQRRPKKKTPPKKPPPPPPPSVPADLLKHPDLTKKPDSELSDRHNKITGKIKELEDYKKKYSALDHTNVNKNLSEMLQEIGRIGQELGNRHTFSLDAAQRMKDFFLANVKSESPLACINTLREGLRQLYDTDSKKTPKSVSDALKMTKHNTIEETMAQMQSAGLAGAEIQVNFVDSKGKAIGPGSGREPVKLQESVWDKIISIADVDRPNVQKEHSYFVFGLSLADGFHSVTLTLDYRDKKKPKIRWSDQTQVHGVGWEEYQREPTGHPSEFKEDSKRGLDEYIEYFVIKYWRLDEHGNERDPKKRPTPIVRLWRLNQPPVK